MTRAEIETVVKISRGYGFSPATLISTLLIIESNSHKLNVPIDPGAAKEC